MTNGTIILGPFALTDVASVTTSAPTGGYKNRCLLGAAAVRNRINRAIATIRREVKIMTKRFSKAFFYERKWLVVLRIYDCFDPPVHALLRRAMPFHHANEFSVYLNKLAVGSCPLCEEIGGVFRTNL